MRDDLVRAIVERHINNVRQAVDADGRPRFPRLINALTALLASTIEAAPPAPDDEQIQTAKFGETVRVVGPFEIKPDMRALAALEFAVESPGTEKL